MNTPVIQRLGGRLGCTEGQAWTVLLGAVFAILLMWTGLPRVLSAADGIPLAPIRQATSTALPAATQPPVVVVPTTSPPGGITAIPTSPRTTPVPFPDRPLPLTPSAPSGPSTSEPTATTAPAMKMGLLDAGWGYAATGTPIDDLDRALVPAGDLPVSARNSTANKVSFLRLRQPGASLRLLPVQDTGANQLQSAAAILICPVTTRAWHGSDGQDLSKAPHYDCTAGHARPGVLQADTSWLFDLSGIPLDGGVRDFALVPAGTASDFQVVFGRPAAR
jgi:hypothetical protein